MISKIESRAMGCLAGIAIGDAMGMPTEFMTREEIKERFGYITSFQNPFKDHPLVSSLKRGQVTDDTQQTLLMAETIIEEKKVSPSIFAKKLVSLCEEQKAIEKMLIGPSTERALKELLAGKKPEEIVCMGTTNGASMRIGPVAIFDWGLEESLKSDVLKSCRISHNTNVAISAAMAVAFAMSKGIEGANWEDVVSAGKKGAGIGERLKLDMRYPAASVEKRIELAEKIIHRSKQPIMDIYDYIGGGVQSNESIPTTFGIFMVTRGDPMKSIITATNMGGDTDTIASIVGGIAGSYMGIEAFPKELVNTIEEINGFNIREIVRALLEIREVKIKEIKKVKG